MSIIFKNSLGKVISNQQAQALSERTKLFFTNNVLVKEEYFYDFILKRVRVHNVTDINHVTILNEVSNTYPNIWIEIVHKSSCNYEHSFYEEFHYSPNGEYKGSSLVLRDSYNNLVSSRFKDIDGILSNLNVKKYYYNPNKDPHSYIFRSDFHPVTAVFQRIDYFDDSIMHPQDKLYLKNTPEDLQKLIDLTGMPLALAQYYFTNEIEPNF